MGWFSRTMVGDENNIEHRLTEQYTRFHQEAFGLNESEAGKVTKGLIRLVKAEAQQSGVARLPQNFGDVLLASEHGKPEIARMSAAKRLQGVRDQDIRWWWNLHFLERGLMLKIDESSRISMFKSLLESGEAAQFAAKRVNQFHPMFGDLDGDSVDGPLPFELKDRINRYIESRSRTDPKVYKADIEASSSFNALVRKEILNGRI